MTVPEAVAYDAIHTCAGMHVETIPMGALVNMNIITASAGLRPLLETGPWEGRLACVFHRSLLCTTSREHLLHLHAGSQLVSPFSLRLEGAFTALLQNVPLQPEMPVRLMGSVMTIAEQLHLRLEKATYYQSPRSFAAAIDPEAVALAWRALRSYGRSGGFDRLPGAQTSVTAMKQALTQGDSGQMLEGARRLIGLGPGLTPSGDDFLVGYLRGLGLSAQHEPTMHQMVDRLRDDLLPGLESYTTRVGAEFIRYALSGAFAEILDRAAEALSASTRPQSVQSAICGLLAQGETSGTDTALGLLTSLEALLSVSHREARHPYRGTASVPEMLPATRV